jgi:hypothetical protein
VDWGATPISQATVSSSMLYVGLAVSGADNQQSITATFDNMTVSTAPNDFYLTASPMSLNISAAGGTSSYVLNVVPLNGSPGTVSFSNAGISGLPTGAVGTFSPETVAGAGTTTLSIATPASSQPGTYALMANGTNGTVNRSIPLTLTVTAAGATFVATDALTQGSWKGVYGSDGEAINGDAISYPSYASVSFNGQNSWTWAGSTSDVRALQKSVGTDRIAATWYAADVFTIDINLTDGNPHRVSLYCLDWDGLGRSQTIDVLDAQSGALVDTQAVSNFSGGKYLTWSLSGHVTLRLTQTGANNALVSGLFFDPPNPVVGAVWRTPTDLTIAQLQQSAPSVRSATNPNITWSPSPTGVGRLAGWGLYTAVGTTGRYVPSATATSTTKRLSHRTTASQHAPAPPSVTTYASASDAGASNNRALAVADPTKVTNSNSVELLIDTSLDGGEAGCRCCLPAKVQFDNVSLAK